MEDKMAAGGFGPAENYGLIAVCSVFEVPLPRFSPWKVVIGQGCTKHDSINVYNLRPIRWMCTNSPSLIQARTPRKDCCLLSGTRMASLLRYKRVEAVQTRWVREARETSYLGTKGMMQWTHRGADIKMTIDDLRFALLSCHTITQNAWWRSIKVPLHHGKWIECVDNNNLSPAFHLDVKPSGRMKFSPSKSKC